MRSHVVTGTAVMTIREVVDTFDLHRQAVLPVVGAEGEYVGAVTVAAVHDRVTADASPGAAGADPGSAITDLVDSAFPSVKPDDPISVAETVMREMGVHTLVVINHGFVVGLLGLSEVCSALVDAAECRS